MKKYFFSFLILIFFSINLSLIEGCAIGFSFFCIFEFLDKIGREFCILELVKVLTVLTTLLVPELFYHYFNNQIDLLNLFEEMPVSVEKYYSFTLPAAFLFTLGLNYNFNINLPKSYFKNLNKALINKGQYSFFFIITGLFFSFFWKLVPSSLTFIFQIFTYLTYVGLLYAVFSNFKHKILIITICFLIAFFQVVSTGMYFEVINFSVVIIFILLTKSKFNEWKKYFVIIFGFFILLVIQSIKTEYRIQTWNGDERNGSASVYFNIISNRISDPSIIFEPISALAFTKRLNHGLIIAKTIDYIPKNANFGYGINLFKSVISSFVPRFIWPNKPKTGGQYNIVRFLGDTDSADNKNSYNLGLIGEAYANFGVIAGCFYLFILGLFMKYIYSLCIKQLYFNPTLLLWYPMLFVSFFSTETDLLSFINAFIKSSLLIAIIFTTSKRIFKISL